jgi:hypothetical protein
MCATMDGLMHGVHGNCGASWCATVHDTVRRRARACIGSGTRADPAGRFCSMLAAAATAPAARTYDTLFPRINHGTRHIRPRLHCTHTVPPEKRIFVCTNLR